MANKANEQNKEISVVDTSGKGVDFRDLDFVFLLETARPEAPLGKETVTILDTFTNGNFSKVFEMEVPLHPDQGFLETLGLSDPNPLLTAVMPFIAGKGLSLAEAIDIVAKLINTVLKHRYFDMWCITSRASWISDETEQSFAEIEKTLDVIRFCFAKLMEGMSEDAVAEIVEKFQKRGIKMVDTAKNPPALEGMHFIQIQLDNSAGMLYIFNSSTDNVC